MLQPLTVLVNGQVVGIAEIDTVAQGDAEYVTEGVIERVKGWVVAMPLTETVPQGEGEKLLVTEFVVQPLTDLVNGWVVGMPVTETVIHGDAEYVTEGDMERV